MVARGHRWTEAEEVLLCRLRLAGLSVAELARTATRLFGEPVSAPAVQARLSRHGVRVQESAPWVRDDEALYLRVVRRELSEDEAFEISERGRGLLGDRMGRWRRTQFRERLERWRWRREHLSEVPRDPSRWPDYRARILVEWGPVPEPDAWREDGEFAEVAAELWPGEPSRANALRHEGWLAARGTLGS